MHSLHTLDRSRVIISQLNGRTKDLLVFLALEIISFAAYIKALWSQGQGMKACR